MSRPEAYLPPTKTEQIKDVGDSVYPVLADKLAWADLALQEAAD